MSMTCGGGIGDREDAARATGKAADAAGRGQTVVMLHTGGVPALFAYTQSLAKAGLLELEQA